ncbi:MAG: hypothetical protein RLZZ136_1326 [Pseudomonadota bacterium]
MTKLTALALIALTTSVIGSVIGSVVGPPVLAAPLANSSLASAPHASASLRIKPQPLSGRAKKGYIFAKAHCAACHGITANATSPNPASPPFDAIANMPALSALTFGRFLDDSHNFPEAMNFKVNHKHTGDLAAYILTLRGEDYRPAI